MRVLDNRKRFKLIWLVLLMSFLFLLSACGSGVSQEDFDAEQARVQQLEVQVQALKQRLDRGAAIMGVLDTLTSSLEGGPSAESILRITPVVHAAGDPQLDAMWEEIGEAISGGGDPPGELLREFVALVEASGNPQILEALKRLGEPPPEVIEEARVKLQSIGDPSLEALFEAAYESAGDEFDAFVQGMWAALRETLQ